MSSTSTHRIYPPLDWFDPSDTVFDIPCLDIRGLTRAWQAMTPDQETIDTFHRLRVSDGSQYAEIGQRWPGNFLECDLRYPPFPDFGIGPLFQAQVMEEKWDIFYCDDGYLYFCRSWTGQLIFRAALETFDNFYSVFGIEVNPEKEYPPDQARMCVDFLIKSHVFGLEAPVYVPEWVVKQSQLIVVIPGEVSNLVDPVKIAQYVFHEYGNRAGFATFQDPSTIQTYYERITMLDGSAFLGSHNLKERIVTTEQTVDCPVLGCQHWVPRQTSHFLRDAKFQCPKHGIFISPSTFEYLKWSDNILWIDSEALSQLNQILTVKHENRLARSNSEDALTWNVFRHLEKTGMLSEILSRIANQDLHNLELFFWTYDSAAQATWKDLETYSQIFGEKPKHGTEPDLIVRTDELLAFIEVKFGSSHNTTPSNENVKAGYVSAAHGWYNKVFSAEFETIAIRERRYELLRQWLIGSRMADRAERQFLLLTVDLESQLAQAKEPFSSLIVQSEQRRFACISWESIYQFVTRFGPPDFDTQILLAYLENKTLSYDKNGCLRKAFDLG
jgi:hypothetical protein